jgi:glycosidase
MEFHISSYARDKYQFDQAIFTKRGNVIFGNYREAQIFSERMKSFRENDEAQQKISAGDLFAMGLLDEIYHVLIENYRKEKFSEVLDQGLSFLNERLTAQNVDQTLFQFNTFFPPTSVYGGEQSVDEYLSASQDGLTNHETTLEEMIVLWLENHNPALSTYQELIDDADLINQSSYAEAQAGLYWFFEQSPKFGPKKMNLIDFLMEPARKHPYSLTDQLAYIQEEWGDMIGDLINQVMRSMDFLAEEASHVAFFGAHPVETFVPDYTDLSLYGGSDIVKFAIDKEWMPKLVLIAKNAYVWLNQLSKQYGREIKYLNEIPDQELDRLRWMGITGLWLIGVWERSKASARIKQLCGNPEALASAYSLSSYHVAADLGGDLAYGNLYHRAIMRGIRLGSDMVPNHMGIDSPWVVEHPDWFIQLSYPPFPAYTFSGPDLSADDRVEVLLEDHYYERSDASVVFLLKEKYNGRHRYIYHGNDGTSMPWNDTAQLNYLIPEVREAVIQTIIDVCKKFPIVRFDAAMTLTKKHFQRLWYPEPGSGGDIPSRAEYGLTKQAFDELLPIEFWQEVVDRVAVEAPDTLLLAEAFWFMEGYFVRSLGMHRVYNSAFMHMLRDEDNDKYRDLIRKTLEFEPEILQRYVNFMNNPDEETAIEQFGNGDKYFGICAMMATMPGLPMLGHGQVEGFHEKYGMEYKQAYWDETPDQFLFDRHARQIFPLLHRREIFSYVENFRLYDFVNESGIYQNVIAYSNRYGDQRSLVVYHNSYAETGGWIQQSIPTKVSGNEELTRNSLVEGLGIPAGNGLYCVTRDQMDGQYYLFATELLHSQGMYLLLHAYQCHVFVDFSFVQDSPEQPYAKLALLLEGRGVPDIQQAFLTMELEPIHIPMREILHPGYLHYLIELMDGESQYEKTEALLAESGLKISNLLDGIEYYQEKSIERSVRKRIVKEVTAAIRALISNPSETPLDVIPGKKTFQKAEQFLLDGIDLHPENRIAFMVASHLQVLESPLEKIEKWKLGDMIADTITAMGVVSSRLDVLINGVMLYLSMGDWYQKYARLPMDALILKLFQNDEVKHFIHVNQYDGVDWFNEELLREFEWWLVACAYYFAVSTPAKNAVSAHEALIGSYEVALQVREARMQANYRFDELISFVGDKKPEKKA